MQNRLQKVTFPDKKKFECNNSISQPIAYLGSSESKSSSSWRTNFWSITFFPAKELGWAPATQRFIFKPIEGWKSGDSRNRRKNSYTSCEDYSNNSEGPQKLWLVTQAVLQWTHMILTVRWGQEASRVGSSSSGSKSGLSLGGNVRNRLHAIWRQKICIIFSPQTMATNW